MKRIRRFFWNLKDDAEWLIWTFSIFFVGCLLWLGVNAALGAVR